MRRALGTSEWPNEEGGEDPPLRVLALRVSGVEAAALGGVAASTVWLVVFVVAGRCFGPRRRHCGGGCGPCAGLLHLLTLQISKARPYFSPLALSSPPALAAGVLVVPDLLLVGELVVRAGVGEIPGLLTTTAATLF
jgi:hypothetical protein